MTNVGLIISLCIIAILFVYSVYNPKFDTLTSNDKKYLILWYTNAKNAERTYKIIKQL